MKNTEKQELYIETLFKDFNNIAVIIKDNYNFSYVNRLGTNLLGFNHDELMEI
jgi:hypothetical protein